VHKIAIKMRIKPPKRRSPLQRLKRRLYYRRNRSKILVQRRRYMRKYRTILKHRKLFRRYKPPFIKKPSKPKHLKPHKIKPRKVKVRIPKKRRR